MTDHIIDGANGIRCTVCGQECPDEDTYDMVAGECPGPIRTIRYSLPLFYSGEVEVPVGATQEDILEAIGGDVPKYVEIRIYDIDNAEILED